MDLPVGSVYLTALTGALRKLFESDGIILGRVELLGLFGLESGFGLLLLCVGHDDVGIEWIYEMRDC